MLELSMSLPIKVQNGGLFISRGVGSHPARQLHSWEIIFVEKGTLTIRENNKVFSVNAGESLLLWPQRLHVGIGLFPSDLKFYWLHFEVTSGEGDALLSIPQHMRVNDPQYIISLFRQFLREQENIHRSVALELILLLILQQISAAAGEQPADSPGNALAWRAQQIIRTRFHLPLFRIHAGAGAALQRGLSGARLSPCFPADVNRSAAPSAGKGGGKAAYQRFPVAYRGGDEMRV